MRKLILGFALLLFGQFSFGQAVSDNAVIPVSVTLNSILRLTVVSGGNIQFVVNTIDQYTGGISNSTRYTTTFTVASSRDFNVFMYSESDALYGTDAGGQLPLENIGYLVVPPATGGGTCQNTLIALDDASAKEIVSAWAAGSYSTDPFQVQWELATAAVQGLAGGLGSLLDQSIPADNYVTNVFLTVAAD